MRREIISLLAAVALGSCSTGRMADPHKAGLADGHPSPNVFTAGDPGETTVLKRAYSIAPPQVPHRVDGYEISLKDNECLECHGSGEEISGGHVPTKVPDSHRLNLFTGNKAKGEGVIGMRFNCLACHVPQATLGGAGH